MPVVILSYTSFKLDELPVIIVYTIKNMHTLSVLVTQYFPEGLNTNRLRDESIGLDETAGL